MLLFGVLQEVEIPWPFLQALQSTWANPYTSATCKSFEAATTLRPRTDMISDWIGFCFLKKFGAMWKRLITRLTVYTVVTARREKEVSESALHPDALLKQVQSLEKWGAETISYLSKQQFYTVINPASHRVVSVKPIRFAKLKYLSDFVQVRQSGSNIWDWPFNYYALWLGLSRRDGSSTCHSLLSGFQTKPLKRVIVGTA